MPFAEEEEEEGRRLKVIKSRPSQSVRQCSAARDENAFLPRSAASL